MIKLFSLKPEGFFKTYAHKTENNTEHQRRTRRRHHVAASAPCQGAPLAVSTGGAHKAAGTGSTFPVRIPPPFPAIRSSSLKHHSSVLLFPSKKRLLLAPPSLCPCILERLSAPAGGAPLLSAGLCSFPTRPHSLHSHSPVNSDGCHRHNLRQGFRRP